MPADPTTATADSEAVTDARGLAAELAAGHPGYQEVDREDLLPWQREQVSWWAMNLEGCLARRVPALLREHDRLVKELEQRDEAAAGLREAVTDLNDELAAAEDRIQELERRRTALLEGMSRSDRAHERALAELQRLRPQPGAAERVESSLQHVYSVLGDRAPSDIDIEALTNGAPWWLDLRDAVDGLADEVRRYTERAPTGHSDPAPALPAGVDLSGMTQARRGGLAVLLAAHRAGAPVYRANNTTAPWEARSRAAAGQHLYLYRGISDWLGTRGLVELVQHGKDSVLQITDQGRQLAEHLEATPPDNDGGR